MISLLSDDGKKKGKIMRKILLAFGLVAAFISFSAMAQSTKGLMFGGTVGFAKPHGSDNSSGTTIGARLGQSIQPNVSWEADVNLGVSDGEIGTDHSWSINSGAVYGVFRTDGDIHLKAKLGVSYWDDDFDHDTSLTAGIGIGFRMGRGILDVEYTQINSYVDYITVGFTLPF
jgi:Outer membrane protein beta-barrel domain